MAVPTISTPISITGKRLRENEELPQAKSARQGSHVDDLLKYQEEISHIFANVKSNSNQLTDEEQELKKIKAIAHIRSITDQMIQDIENLTPEISSNYFSLLPIDTKLIILSYIISDFVSLKKILLTSKDFNELCFNENMRFPVNFESNYNNDYKENYRLLEMFREKIMKIEINNYNNARIFSDYLDFLGGLTFPNLHNFSLIYDTAIFIDRLNGFNTNFLLNIKKNFPNLQVIRLINIRAENQLNDFINEYQNLKHLEIVSQNNAMQDAIFNGLNRNEKLISIKLGRTELTDEGIRHLANKCLNLTYFNLNGSNVTDKGIKHIANKCLNLTYFNLNGSNVTDKGIKNMGENCSNLTRLKLSRALVTDKGVEFIFNKLLKLRRLNLSHSEGITDEAFNSIDKCSNLISLNLSNTDIGDKVIEKIVKIFPNLKKFTGSHTCVSMEGIRKLVSLKNITYIDVSEGDNNLTKAEIKALEWKQKVKVI